MAEIILVWAARLVEWVFTELGRIGDGAGWRADQEFHLASVKSQSGMKNECASESPAPGIQMSVITAEGSTAHLRGHREAWRSPALSGCGSSPQLPPPPEASAVYDSPSSKERSVQLGQPLFILPEGSCLDNVFHSILIEFCPFLKFNFKVVNRLNTLCLLPKVLAFQD